MNTRLVAVLWLASIGGCATVVERPPAPDARAAWSARNEQLAPIDAWELYGRVALQSQTDGWSASLRWVRDADRHDIDLTGPLGSGHVRLRQDASGAELRDSEHKVLRDSNAESLLFRATGWLLPVDGLNYWVLGLPAPGGANDVQIDRWGRPQRISQHGWQVQYLDYAQFGRYELPSRLFLKRRLERAEAPAAADEPVTLEVRLVVDRWALKSSKQ